MAEKKQFDAFLGGSQSLPHEVSIMKVVAARASEISSMTYSIENPEMTKLIFQKLPVYMRRRAMSHNVKRLPRKLREAHLNQMAKSGLPPKSKRPSRKHRRRPSNLLSKYNRRQLKKHWLETHIWHAKRFHMVDRWGYRIADHPNDKCFRANYRAATEHCLLQDISYYTCIEINGEENLLKTTLKTHCKPFGLSFISIKYMNGRNEGTLMFFRKNGYPQFPIGNVHFLWRPKESNIRTIWIWVHPAFYIDFLNEITSSFKFKESDAEEDVTDVTHSLKYLYINDAGCKMMILRNALNRFRLYGPLTLKVLTYALQVPSLTESDLLQEMNSTATEEQDESLNNIKLNISKESIDNDVLQSVKEIVINEVNAEDKTDSKILSIQQQLHNKTWHIEYYKHKENREAFKVQKKLWEELKTSEETINLPESVIGLTVLDPRFYLHEKKMERKKEMTFFQFTLMSPTNLNYTPIWDTQIRHIVSDTCLSTSEFNMLRSKCLVPGVANDKYYNEGIMAKIPILLVPRPGSYKEAFVDSGIDIIIPAGWAMPIWLALVQQCVRVGALRESRFIAFESLNPNTPDVNDPDSPAYMEEALTRKEELTKKYFRYPPNRRVNFIKLGITSPFFCDWKILIKEWSGTEDFYVLRDRAFLLFLQAGIRLRSPTKNNNTKCPYVQTTQIDLQDLDKHKNCLVCVKVSMMKGVPNDFAIICIPTSEDLKKLESDKRWIGPEEQCHVDSNEATRKVSRKNHLLLLKRLRRQRIRQKKLPEGNVSKLLEQSTEILDKSVDSNNALSKIISEQSEKMSKLYLPKCTKVRYSCDREVMGYITAGDFSLVRAKGIGIGYVVLPSLVEMINKKSNIVLIRNTQTRQYKLATLDLLGI
ncbi:ribonucleases P/MRP protein subunit POP1 [Odontomachus brunneus]|uniref:ribonucleases P/MRP protein subunit POP1 n=1 Tax=Odontomachus brunneus TaxID=486640 RepID=UPI0013F1F43F|nr:ribonucleases P/MRP protein subunit POP1 [Odontomachus brunneus]XP_032674886.1 ribonucleases P/MRP protein subunit POP1 [Odontomachus brunneus]XP_032674887.1 ribonucleases P/MRP protein subunit POP1 [Odontomachus brunneus]